MERRRFRHPGRSAAFTLVELLVVLLIISIVAAITLPVVLPAIGHRQVSESARIIQGGLVAARDAALRTNSPHGIRLLPDPANNGVDPAAPGKINPYRALASNRFIPIEQPPGYSEGKVSPNTGSGLGGLFDAPYWDNDTLLASGVSAQWAYWNRHALMLVQSVFAPIPGSNPTQYTFENPTSWYWNIRVGDRIQINNLGRYYTVVGPVQEPNPEMFVNIGSLGGTLRLVAPDGSTNYYPEVLFLVDGLDGDGDGYVDNGWDGVDNNGDGAVDDIYEWSEIESWPSTFGAGLTGINTFWNGLPYRIVRQPVPSPGARETLLPDNVVVDLTSWGTEARSSFPPERSRLPVDPMSGTVDILLEPSGRVVPTTRYSSPASFGMNQSFYHIWVAERGDLAEVATNAGAPVPLLAAPTPQFYLPMPQDAYDRYSTSLTASNPTLPVLKGQIRLLSLSTRTGNLLTTDSPVFDVNNTSRPYHAAQLGRQGGTP